MEPKETREYEKIVQLDKECFYVQWVERINCGPFETADEALAWITKHSENKNYKYYTHSLLTVKPADPPPQPSKRQKRFFGKG